MPRHNDKILKEVLQEMMDKYEYKDKLYQSKIRKFWLEVMGTSINQYTTTLNLKGKKLFIAIESASLRQELSFGKEKLKDALNREIGEEYIEEVFIR